MRWLITLVLLVLVLLGGGWLLVGDRVRSTLGFANPDQAVAVSFTQLDQDLRPESIRKVEVRVPGHAPLTLHRSAEGAWSQPGNWPVRETEAETLVSTLTGLRSRFAAVPIDTNLAEYGLDNPNARVEVTIEVDVSGTAKTLKLVFTQPETVDDSEFVLPCYLRVDDNPEVVRLGPDVYPILARSPEVYRRRQLFPDVERVKLSGPSSPGVGGRVAILGDAYQSIRVVRPINYEPLRSRTPLDADKQVVAKGAGGAIEGVALKLAPDPNESVTEEKAPPEGPDPIGSKSKPLPPDAPAYTLRREHPTPTPHRDPDRSTAEPALAPDRLAAAWTVQLDLPSPALGVKDRTDPAKLRSVLTAIPELWVESFLTPTSATGLDNPERSVTVTRTDGKTVTLQIGHVTRRTVKTEAAPPPMFPGAPTPPPKETVEEYRYAKLKDNDLVFELRTDPLNDLFADPQELRDGALARFDTAEVNELTLAMPDRPPVTIKRRKGNKFAEKDEDQQDRWYVGDVLADTKTVTDLIDQLRKLEAKGEANVLDHTPAAKLKELDLGATVTVVAQTRVADGEPVPASRTYSFALGKEPAVWAADLTASALVGSVRIAAVDRAPRLAMRLSGWDRVNLVDAALQEQLDRPSLAYRSRRLFDTAELKLTTVTATRRGGPGLAGLVGGSESLGSTFALEQATTRADGWNLTRPVRAEADGANAGQFTDTLARLAVTDYLDASRLPPSELPRRALGGVAAGWAADVTRYGLAEPRAAFDLGFTGTDARPRTLVVGKGTADAVYAWLADEQIPFTIPKQSIEPLNREAVGLLPSQLWSTTPDRIVSVAVRRPERRDLRLLGFVVPARDEAYTLNRVDTGWAIAGPFAAPAGSDEVQLLLTVAATVQAVRYDALAVDVAKHGIDARSLRLAITYRDAAGSQVSKALLLGKPAGPGLRFAKLDNPAEQAVFVVPQSLALFADQPAVARLDRSLLTLPRADVTALRITGPTPDSNVTLTKVSNVAWKAEGQAFKLDQPTLNALLAEAVRPTIATIKAYGPTVNWAAFGLDSPEYTLTLTVGGEKPSTHTLKIGKTSANGERHVRIDDGPAVGLLDVGAAESLARGKLELIDRTLFAFPKDALGIVLRTTGAEEFELVRGALTWEITKPAKQKADRQAVEDLAEVLASLRSVKVVAVAPADLDPFGLKTPAATFMLAVDSGNPGPKVLKLGKLVDPAKPDGERYVTASSDGPVTVGVLAGPQAKKLLNAPLKFREWTQPRFVDVDRVTLERGTRLVTFTKVEGTWKVADSTTAEADHRDLEEFVAELGKLRADELVADKPADLKPFGLDKPDVKWKLFYGPRELLSLHVGAKEKDGPRVYAKLEKGDLVALLSPEATTRVLREYQPRAIWPPIDPMLIESIAVSSGTDSFALNRTAMGWVDPRKPGEPIDAERVAETVAALAALRAERFVMEKPPQLEPFGLDKPKWVIVVTTRGGPPLVLHLGRALDQNPKQVYAARPDQPGVFALYEADAAKLTRDRTAYAAKK